MSFKLFALYAAILLCFFSFLYFPIYSFRAYKNVTSTSFSFLQHFMYIYIECIKRTNILWLVISYPSCPHMWILTSRFSIQYFNPLFVVLTSAIYQCLCNMYLREISEVSMFVLRHCSQSLPDLKVLSNHFNTHQGFS
jgi:hypothetical protein